MPNNITHKPLSEIPERERWLYENPEALAAVMEGLKAAAEGRLVYLGSFAKFLEDDVEPDLIEKSE